MVFKQEMSHVRKKSQEESRNVTNSSGKRKIKLPPMELRPYPSCGWNSAFDARKDDLNNTREFESVRYDSQSRLYLLAADIEHPGHDKELTALLNIHSYGVPLIISFGNPADAEDNPLSSSVRAVFHCPVCFTLWQETGKLASPCDEVPSFVEKLNYSLSVTDACILMDILVWSKKYLPRDLERILPSLRQANSEREKVKMLKLISQPTESSTMEDKHFNLQANNRQAIEKACSLRNRMFANPAGLMTPNTEKELNWYSDEFVGKIKIVGMRGMDGSFYPGFFSKQNIFNHKASKKDSDENIGTLSSSDLSDDSYRENLEEKRFSYNAADFVFLPRGKVDDDGCYRSYKDDEEKATERIQFPMLRDVINEQNRRRFSVIGRSQNLFAPDIKEPKGQIKTNQSLKRFSKFVFSLQEGIELNLSGIFSSGLWLQSTDEECFIAGVFSMQGYFKASYCITKDGYLAPGTSDDKGKFVPLSKYDEDGGVSQSEEFKSDANGLTPELHMVFQRLTKLPACPTAAKIKENNDLIWTCIKFGMIVSEPKFISVILNGYSQDEEGFEVYIGGEKGPENLLYLYGKRKVNGMFSPGGPPVSSQTSLHQLQCDDPSIDDSIDNFYERFGIRLHEKLKSAKNDKEKEDNSQFVSEDLSSKSKSITFQLPNEDKHEHMKPSNKSLSEENTNVSVHFRVKTPVTFRSRTPNAGNEQHETPSAVAQLANKGANNAESFDTYIDNWLKERNSDQISNGMDSPRRLSTCKPEGNLYVDNLVNQHHQGRLRRGSLSVDLHNRQLSEFSRKRSDSITGGEDVKLMPPAQPDQPKDQQVLNSAVKNRTGRPVRRGSLAPPFQAAPLSSNGKSDSQPELLGGLVKPLENFSTVEQIPVDSKSKEDDTRTKTKEKLHQLEEEIKQKTEEQKKHQQRRNSRRHSIALQMQITNVANQNQAANKIATKNLVVPTTLKNKYEIDDHSSSAPTVSDDAYSDTHAAENRQGNHGNSTSKRKNSIKSNETPNLEFDLANFHTTHNSQMETGLDHEDLRRRVMTCGIFKKDESDSKLDGNNAGTSSSNISGDFKRGFTPESPVRRSSMESAFLPQFDSFSALSFTQNFLFSYFAVPKHVQEYNKKISAGAIKLPNIKAHSRKNSTNQLLKRRSSKGSEHVNKSEKN